MEAVDSYRDLNLNANSLYVFYKAGIEAIENKRMSKLESRIRVIHGEGGEYLSFLINLRETNPQSYKNLKKMLRIAYKRKIKENKYN